VESLSILACKQHCEQPPAGIIGDCCVKLWFLGARMNIVSDFKDE
jgi:hypothetical protein